MHPLPLISHAQAHSYPLLARLTRRSTIGADEVAAEGQLAVASKYESISSSRDGGLSWSNSFFYTRPMVGADVAGGVMMVCVASSASLVPQVVRSVDGGLSWSSYINASANTNAGATATSISGSSAGVWLIASNSPSVAYLHRSANHGAGWGDLANPISGARWFDCAIDGSVALVVGDQSGVGCIYRSVDAGLTFAKLSIPVVVTLEDVSISGSIAAAVANDGACLMSNDSGASWTVLNTGLAGAIDCDVLGSTICFASTNGLAVSRDAGLSWSIYQSPGSGTPSVCLSSGFGLLSTTTSIFRG